MSNEELKSIAGEIKGAMDSLVERLDTLFGSGAKETDGAILLLQSAYQRLLNLIGPEETPEVPVEAPAPAVELPAETPAQTELPAVPESV